MNYCPAIGQSSRTWHPARREDQKRCWNFEKDTDHWTLPLDGAQTAVTNWGTRGRPLSTEDHAKKATTSRVHAKGDHTLLVIKRILGFTPVR
jgi:hypothetical protein